MSAEEMRHVAMPRLMGAPAYARPTVPVARIERPFDPDDLPLQAVMTEEERDLLVNGPRKVQPPIDDGSDARMSARPFTLRGLTSRLRRAAD
jgi:hypothetical protein